ncbi:MAG: glycoside hydrolase family 43 protein [Formivibrio sp.]|nr:glycoside hydrolase family 43 protein [Formivibrio sp.]
MIRNPILPGFNADPSIVRVGDDYFIATSTFEWYPGVQIHHSRDLVNWQLRTRPLARASQLDLRGNPDSCGVWAPCLSHANGRFWLVYSDVKRKDGNFKDVHNYLVTADSIDGPWSDPVYLNSSGFDPSLFHDEDGRKWLVNLVWDHRIKPSKFGGILLQEYDANARQLVGPVCNIFGGSPLGLTEGPHLYRRNGWYYLMTAEGGTGYRHAVTMARSRTLEGPYALHPDWHVLTSRHHAELRLQRAGHGDFVQTQHDEVYLVHLASRPYPGLLRSPLGRETSIQKVEWGTDDWLRLAGKPLEPLDEVPAPALPEHRFLPEATRHDFDVPVLPLAFQWLRTPYPERLFSLTERPGHLRLFGRESVGSWFEQALLARRQTSFNCMAETMLDYAPQNYQQLAGLVAYYNRYQFHYLAVTFDPEIGRCLTILSCPADWPDGRLVFPLADPVPLPGEGPVRLRLEITQIQLQFSYALDSASWCRIGPALDAMILSDEAGQGESGNFTGAFVGMCANDMTGSALQADFDYFEYQDLEGAGQCDYCQEDMMMYGDKLRTC